MMNKVYLVGQIGEMPIRAFRNLISAQEFLTSFCSASITFPGEWHCPEDGCYYLISEMELEDTI